MRKTVQGRPAPQYDAEAERSANVVGSRIAEARRDRGWSLSTMAERLRPFGVDLGKAALSKWENGDSVPNVYQFLAVCRALGMDDRLSSYAGAFEPELNAEGRRKLDEYRRDLIGSGNYRPAPKQADVIRFCEMPVAYMTAAAGTGNQLDDMDFYETVSFPADAVKKGADVGIRVSGDSMEPVYHDGQIVWVEKRDALLPGEVGVFIYEGRGYIKVYSEREPEPSLREEFTDSYGTVHPQPVLISYNGAYAPLAVSPYSTFRIFGRVLR